MNHERQPPAEAEMPQEAAARELPQTATLDDPAVAAFEALRAEVALVRRAVAGLAAERANTAPPDYSETLGNILQVGMAAARRLKTLGEMPALQLTPDVMTRQITAAAETTRRTDHLALGEACTSLQQVMQDMKAALRSDNLAKRQRLWLLATGIGGLVAGMVVWAVIAGHGDHTPPVDHRSPEAKAAAILGMDQVAAGEHLIRSAEPQRWQAMQIGERIVGANRKALDACRRKNGKQREHCVIQIPIDQP